MIKTIIVDDDLLMIESLAGLLHDHFKHVQVIATCCSVPDAVKKIDELNPQLVFLDIEMGSLTGFDMLAMVNVRNFEVIFTTSYNHYAVQAIKASALDFIEKPVIMANLTEALQRYREKTGMSRIDNLLANFKAKDEDQKIALPDTDGLRFFNLKNIVRCESFNSTTIFYLLGEKGDGGKYVRVVVSKGFYQFEDFLTDKGFFYRVHNEHIVNINHIKKYIKGEGGYLVMDNDPVTEIPVARARKEDFLNFLRSQGLFI
ncbi:MAG: response regulator [Mariniphaga sp.]